MEDHFEVLSTSSTHSDSHSDNDDCEESYTMTKETNTEEDLTQNNKRIDFMSKLYAENRDLHNEINDCKAQHNKLQEKNIYLLNSNTFLLFCSFGSLMCNLICFLK